MVDGWAGNREGCAGVSALPTSRSRRTSASARSFCRAAKSARAEELYGIFPALSERRRALAGSLSGGQRKMLVMDEPSAGLSPLFVKEVVRVLAGFRGQGLSFLIAEQNVKFLDLADRVYTVRGRTHRLFRHRRRHARG